MITVISESKYAPTEIFIRGRAIHWSTYTVQEAVFYLDGFNDEGYPIYAGVQKKMTKDGKKFRIHPETDERMKNGNFNMVYLTHDSKFDAGENEMKRAIENGETNPGKSI